jgi:DNA-binding transcriptional LysR family regulator
MNAQVTTSSVGEHVQPDDIVLNPVRLAVFCKVVEQQSFARAAEDLAITPAAVSTHVRMLEALWGTRLIERQRRGARLTEAGEALYEYAVAVLGGLATLRGRIEGLKGGHSGVVTIGATLHAASYILPEVLVAFQMQYPAAQLRLRPFPHDVVAEHVARGRMDLGLVSETTPVSRGLRLEPLWVEPLALVATPRHRLARRVTVSLADLVGEPFISARTAAGDLALDAAFARAQLPPRRIVMEAGNPNVSRVAALKGIGLTVVLRRVVAADLAAGHLVALSLEEPELTEQFLLICRDGHELSPLARRLIGYLHDDARPAWAPRDQLA